LGLTSNAIFYTKKYFAPKNIISKFDLLKIIVRVKPLKLLAFNPLALQRNITSLFVIKVNEAIQIRVASLFLDGTAVPAVAVQRCARGGVWVFKDFGLIFLGRPVRL